MAYLPDTIAALATPAGTSAIAVVRASGPAVPELLARIFGPGTTPRTATRADYRDRHGRLIDDVLYTWFAAPHSYTGEDILEISCHGNPFIVLQLLEDLQARGCRPAEAFLHGRMDLSQAEAVMDLIHARSKRALAVANQHLRGSLGRTMEELVVKALECLSQVEAYIDFPEDDLPVVNRAGLVEKLEELQQATSRLLATSHYGEMLRTGIKTVIVGEPNAGKSSLLNRLLGCDRALVSPEPGTTRDYLTESLIIGPHMLRLIDTAGLNVQAGPVERLGMDKTLEQAAEADLYLWVIDATTVLSPLPSAIMSRMTADNTLALFNKCDLPHAGDFSVPNHIPALAISTLSGAGLDELQRRIVALVDTQAGANGSELIAISARHAEALARAAQALQAALVKTRLNAPTELLASDLRALIEALGDISGKIDNEKMLDKLFSTFCIGK